MKRISLLTVFLFMLSLSAFAQKPGTADYLLVKRGFKIFKLGESIEKYSKYVKVLPGDENSHYEVIDTELFSVGKDIKLKRIVLYVNDSIVAGISVFLDSQYNEKFLATLMAAYGSADPISAGLEVYFWRSGDKLVQLVYYDKYKDNQSLAMFSLETAFND